VNWWVSYPARPVNGFLVTDRLKALMTKKSIADEPNVVYPDSLVEELRPLFLDTQGAAHSMREAGFPSFSQTKARDMFHTSEASRNLYASLLTYAGQDRMVADWALHLLGKGQPDLFAVVLRITDVFAHFGWRFADRATLERIVPLIGDQALTSGDETVRDGARRLTEELDHAVARAMRTSSPTTLSVASSRGWIRTRSS
jgi:hypothetical protein